MNDDWKAMNPFVTVLMSVYNGERWLFEAIQSVLTQSFADFEFIIVNDGSKDCSLEIINQFAARDRRIVIIDKPNTGLADSLNQGIKQAKGQWIARIDADDLCVSDRLQKQYEFANADSSLVLIGSGLRVINETGVPGRLYCYPASHVALVNGLVTFRQFFAHSSAFYNTEVVRKLGGYRPRIKRSQDFDLWLRLSEVGKIGCINKPLVKIRKHSLQISNDDQGQQQIIDSRIAMTSYWLRREGFVDPVAADCSDADFNNYRSWVKTLLHHNQTFEYYTFVKEFKQKLNIEGMSFAGYLTLFLSLLHEHVFVFRYLREALIGDRFQKKISALWIKKNQ